MPGRIRVVLVRPRRGGNVGAVARVMKNMGLGELVLVAPRTRVGKVGERMAAHARDVLLAHRVVPDLASALRGCHLVVGTVGRPVIDRAEPRGAREIAAEVAAESAAAGRRVALVFGPEDHGLSNAEIDLCQRVLRIPTAPAYGSLNLAQAVGVCVYEIYLARLHDSREGGGTPTAGGASKAGRFAPAASRPNPKPAGARAGREGPRPATSEEREEMLRHLASALDGIGFLSRQNPAHILRDLRSLFGRAGLTTRDVGIWRGIARQMLWAAGAKPARGPISPPSPSSRRAAGRV